MTEPRTSSVDPNLVCYLTKRKFRTAEELKRHEDFSQLYMDTYNNVMEDMLLHKNALYHRIQEARREYADAEAAMEKTVLYDESVAQQKSDAETKIFRAEKVIGQIQHKQELLRAYKDRRELSGKAGQEMELRPGWTLHAFAETWQGNKDVQEDRYVIDMVLCGGKVVAYAVMDGHTGSKCVEFMEASLERALHRAFEGKRKKEPDEELCREVVREACRNLDEDFAKLAKAHELNDGTTLNLLLFFEDRSDVNIDGTVQPRRKVLCANVGDSRSVALTREKHVRRLSEDHKPSRKDEEQRINEVGGSVQYIHGIARVFTLQPINLNGRMLNLGLSVSRSMGDYPLKFPTLLVDGTPEFRCIDVEGGEVFVMACDGVWDEVSDSAAVRNASTDSREEAARRVVEQAFSAGSNDNLTAIVVFCDMAGTAWQNGDADAAEPKPKKQRKGFN